MVYSWYLDDCWDSESVASKEIRTVNNMHRYYTSDDLLGYIYSHFVLDLLLTKLDPSMEHYQNLSEKFLKILRSIVKQNFQDKITFY